MYSAPLSGAQTAASHTHIVNYDSNAVSIDVMGNTSGVLVLHDIYYPGWQVYVDGKRRPLLRANLLFRGVEIEAGHHRVEFRFDPLSLDNLWAAASDLVDGDRNEQGKVAISAAQ